MVIGDSSFINALKVSINESSVLYQVPQNIPLEKQIDETLSFMQKIAQVEAKRKKSYNDIPKLNEYLSLAKFDLRSGPAIMVIPPLFAITCTNLLNFKVIVDSNLSSKQE